MNTDKLPSPEIKAEIYYFTELEGGRKSPVKSGYRGQFYYNGHNWDAQQEFINKQWCKLGEHVFVYLQCNSPENHIGHLYKGKKFEIREGVKIIGKGSILDLIRKDYQKWETKDVLNELENLDIKPYSSTELDGMIFDIDHFLSQNNKFRDIRIAKSDEKNCLLNVNCRTKNRSDPIVLFSHDLLSIWKEKIAFEKEKHKSTIFDHKVQLDFITWHTNYVTGKIIISNE